MKGTTLQRQQSGEQKERPLDPAHPRLPKEAGVCPGIDGRDFELI